MSNSLFDPDIKLETSLVQLRIINSSDAEAFRRIMFEKETWEFYTEQYSDEFGLQEFVGQAIADFQSKTRCPFAVIERKKRQVIGSTSFGNISSRDKRIEIGWTWLCKDSRGRGANRHAKFLLLEYAFEVLQYQRVEFKTDVLNQAARKALLKIGAVEEGILRSHTQMHSNRRRDTIYYSILRDEWPKVRDEHFEGITSTNSA